MRALFTFCFIAISVACAADSAPECAFCAIAAGKTEAGTICYRDETVVAFMSRAPRNPGHVLIVPILHAKDLLDTPPTTVEHLASVAQMIARAIKDTDIKAEGFTVQSSTGKAAGQSVFHFHVHVIPRFTGETPDTPGSRPVVAATELEIVAGKIRAALEKQPNKALEPTRTSVTAPAEPGAAPAARVAHL